MSALPGYPGQNCPGLIEAHPKAVRQRPSKPRIRGKIAPASLKHHALNFKQPRSQSIRGKIAPASLKLVVKIVGHLPSRGIRGKIAPASLKPAGISGAADVKQAYPGQNCPGLIEA